MGGGLEGRLKHLRTVIKIRVEKKNQKLQSRKPFYPFNPFSSQYELRVLPDSGTSGRRVQGSQGHTEKPALKTHNTTESKQQNQNKQKQTNKKTRKSPTSWTSSRAQLRNCAETEWTVDRRQEGKGGRLGGEGCCTFPTSASVSLVLLKN